MNILRKSNFIGMIIVVAAISSLSAIGGEAPKHGQIPFAAFDKDGNGWVSKAEFNEVKSHMMASGKAAGAKGIPSFADFDKNGDGKLSKGELTAGH